MDFTAGYFVIEAASKEISVLRFVKVCAPVTSATGMLALAVNTEVPDPFT